MDFLIDTSIKNGYIRLKQTNSFGRNKKIKCDSWYLELQSCGSRCLNTIADRNEGNLNLKWTNIVLLYHLTSSSTNALPFEGSYLKWLDTPKLLSRVHLFCSWLLHVISFVVAYQTFLKFLKILLTWFFTTTCERGSFWRSGLRRLIWENVDRFETYYGSFLFHPLW